MKKKTVDLLPSPGSVYPCVQNILLACRAEGLGASLTTMLVLRTNFVKIRIPEEYGIVAVIPMATQKEILVVSRVPSSELTY